MAAKMRQMQSCDVILQEKQVISQVAADSRIDWDSMVTVSWRVFHSHTRTLYVQAGFHFETCEPDCSLRYSL